jgi:hypothetical protein
MDPSSMNPNWDAPPPRRGMSTGMKVFLALLIVGGVCAFLCCGGAVWFSYWVKGQVKIETDPVAVQKMADDIAKMDVPPGYRPAFAFQFSAQMQWAVFSEEASRGTIILAHMGSLMNQQPQEQMVGQVEESLRQQGNGPMVDPVPGTAESKQKELKVRGQNTFFTFTKGKDPKGGERLKVTGVFPDKGGRTVVVVSADTAKTSEAEIVKMIESIK